MGYDPDSISSDILKISSLIQKLLGFKKNKKNRKQDFQKSTLHSKSNGKWLPDSQSVRIFKIGQHNQKLYGFNEIGMQ